MTSPLLALFARSVREDTRAKSTYWARAGLAAFMVVVMVMAAFAGVMGGAPGRVFLQNSLWLQTIFVTITGLGWFASAITEEKEEETLGLLRMTNLNPLSILLGKSTSRLSGALLLIASQLPFTLLAVTLGGVSPRQVFAAYATLGAYTFLLCNLALLASVIVPRTGLAVAVTSAALLVGWFVSDLWPPLAAFSPFRRLYEVFATGFDEPLLDWQVGGSLLVGVLCFAIAWALFERLCGGRAERAPSDGNFLRHRFRGWFAPGRPEAFHALAWKDFQFLHGGRGVQVAKSVGCVLLIVGALGTEYYRHGRVDLPSFCASVFFLSILWLVAEAGFVASRICACEVRDRTLSSLALLPRPLSSTISAKVSAGQQALIPAWSLLGVTVAFSFCLLMTGTVGGSVGFLVFSGIFGVYALAMSYLGVMLAAYLSLRMKRGALPLAVIICLASAVFLMIPLFGWFGVPIAAVLTGQSLRNKIFLRLDDLAAED